MITFQETLQQPKPSAQLQTAKPVAKPMPEVKPNLGQKIISGIGNAASAIKKDISSTKLTGILPNSAAFKNVKAIPTFGDAYRSLVKKDSTIDTVVQGKFDKVPQAFKNDIQYQKDNFKKQANIQEKAYKGIPLSPEEKQFHKERTVGMLGMVDGGVTGKIAQELKEEAPTAVKRVIAALKGAESTRGKQEALYTAERAKRVAQVVEAGKVKGEQGFFAQKRALSGELPKQEFKGIRDKISQDDIDELFNTVESNVKLTPLDKVAAKSGLSKLLGEEGGSVPQTKEISLLNEVFGQEFTDTVLSKRGVLQKITDKVAEVANIPRALNSSIDLSASGRQGVFAVPSHPVAAAKSFVKQFQAAFSEGGYDKVMEAIQQKPSYKIARDVGVAFTDTKGIISGKEEAYMSNLAEKIPLLGKLVRASDRGYSGFLNNFRAELFDGFYKNAEKLGRGNDLKLLKNYAGLVNNMTGRGDLGAMNRYAPLLNGAFFSPRLMASRIQLMNPVYYARLDPVVRKEGMKSLVAFVGTGLSILGMAKAAGLEVGTDPRSSDFGKIKLGNTRYDIWGGFSQYAVALSRVVLNESVSSTSGKVTKFGEGYKPTNRREIVERFAESKLAPIPSFTNDALKGQDQLGQPFKLLPEDSSMEEIEGSQVYKRLTPFFVQDFMKVVREYGLPTGALMAVPAFFGIGGNTYGETPVKSKFKVGPLILR